jgi:hypothetical protein
MINPDEGKSEEYIRRRNWLLEKVKRTKWDDVEEKPQSKRGRKPKSKPKPMVDLNKPRNKYFKYN